MGTEDAFTDRLSDYLDNEEMGAAHLDNEEMGAVHLAGEEMGAVHLAGEEMGAAERAAIEAHLATCGSCQTALAELREVAARAASLPDAAPVVDLWAGVAERLTPSTSVLSFARPKQRRFSFTLPQLVAAGLALMVLSGGMVWIARLGDPRASLPPVIATADAPPSDAPQSIGEEPVSMTPANFANAHYDQAVADLEKTLADGRSRLDAETVRILEENLRLIDLAIDQSRKALRADPANLYLNNHFAASRNRKLALLRRASALAMAPDSSGGS